MTQQMTFEDYRAEHVMLNPSVSAADEARLGPQADTVLKLFLGRAHWGQTVSTIDLRAIGCQYNARLWEVRRYLASHCDQCIDRVKKDGGVNHYKLVPLAESEFYREHKDKF